MFYTLFILYSLFYLIYQFVISFGNFKQEQFNICLKKFFNFGKNYLGWKVKLFNNIDKLTDNKVVLYCNHINYIDVFIIPYILTLNYPEYKIMYISRHKYAKLPIVGKYLLKNHILIKNNLVEDITLIKKKLDEFEKNNDKIILVIFPEGTFMCPDTIKASNKWCDKMVIEPYKNCLAPRTSGIYSVLKILKPEKIIEATIDYPDNPKKNKGTEYYHILFDYFPKNAVVSMKLIDNNFNLTSKENFETEYYEYWRNIYDN